jgi:hypothetical protein
MNTRSRLLTLSIALVLLVGSYIAGTLMYRPGQATEATESAFPTVSVPESITIEKPGDTRIVLRSTDAGWMVDERTMSYPARRARVDQLIESVRGARLGRMVTQDPGALESLGISDDQAYRLAIEESGKRVEALFGDRGTTPETVYFRYPASNRGRVLHGGVRFYLTQRPAFWADLRLFFGRLEPSSVVRIDSQGLSDGTEDNASGGVSQDATGDFTIFRQGDTWVFEGGGEDVRQSRAEQLVRSAVGIEGTRYENYDPRAEWDRVLRLHLDDGRVFSLYAGSYAEEGVVRLTAQGPGLPTGNGGFPYHYVAPRSLADQVLPDKSELTVEAQES